MRNHAIPNSFAIFGPDTFRFFRELARNNRKSWMDQHREDYREAIVGPMHALLDRLTPAVLRLNPRFDVSGRTGYNFSRINRDIRFAADKSPYRPQMYLKFAESAKGEDGGAGELYVGVGGRSRYRGLPHVSQWPPISRCAAHDAPRHRAS